jgi:ubiquinone/menaquinone biosynthesis C-methylase UbiE
MASALERLSFQISQRLRTAWFSSQYAVTNRVSTPTSPPTDSEKKSFPNVKMIAADLQHLFERDWKNIEAGLYLSPEDKWPNPIDALKQTARYFQDLQKVNRRKLIAGQFPKSAYPAYYLHNFHYQSDGYLSEESAQLYDYQVEVLFTGGADAMRRQALVPIGAALRRPGIRQAKLLDVGCGTGRFLKTIKQNFPRLWVNGLDLSPPYLKKAQSDLAPWSRQRVVQGMAEHLPFADQSFDVVSCIYLFHELPRPVRRQVATEFKRVLKPDGRLVFVDSLQPGDHPPYDSLLSRFPEATHEPYYSDYLNDDLTPLFAGTGFQVEAIERAFFSRMMLLKPAL